MKVLLRKSLVAHFLEKTNLSLVGTLRGIVSGRKFMLNRSSQKKEN